MSTNWSLVEPWRESDAKIGRLVQLAHETEKTNPEPAVAQYREAVTQILALDALGETAAAWRTNKYPMQRLSLVLDRLGRKAAALAEIERWGSCRDPVGISDADRESVEKRKARLSKTTAAK